jgi:hypothetical protein
MHQRLASYVTFLGLIGYMVGVRLILDAYFDDSIFPHPSQRATFSWVFIGCLIVAGLVGVALAQLTGFPEMWDPKVSQRNRFVLPAILGVSFGFLEIEAARLTGLEDLAVKWLQIPFFHMRFPASLMVYPGGAIIVDTLTRLLPIPLFMAATLGVIWLWKKLRGRPMVWSDCRSRVFWIYALLLSWFEPVTQSGVISMLQGKPTPYSEHQPVMLWELVSGYFFNLAQAVLFWRAGFLACLTMRVAMYLVWHVLWGYIGQATA